MNNKISIIVPIFNSEKYLEKCLDSIVNQTYKNLEIILVNDGSTDNSLLICERYGKKDKRIVIIDIKNGGTAHARNSGLDIATGDLFYFIDSDDFIELDLFDYLLSLLIKNNADIAFSPYLYVDEEYRLLERKNNRESEKITIYNNKEAVRSFLEWDIPCCMCDKLFKRELFNDLRLLEGYLCEDLNIVYVLLSRSNKVVSSNLQKYYYVNRSSSQMRSEDGFKKLTNSIILVIDRMIDFYKKNYPDLYYNAICYGLDEFFIYLVSIPPNKNFKDFKNNLNNYIKKYIKLLPKNNICLKKIKFKIFVFNLSPDILCFLVRFIRRVNKFFPVKH
jgi:glycosyltransferase involved in cell wall biosynthesis